MTEASETRPLSVDPSALVTELLTALPTWLPTQRWFAGKDREVSGVRAVSSDVVLDGDPFLLHLVVDVDQDGRHDTYQLLVGSRQAQVPDVASSASIGVEAGVPCYEASGDAEVTGAVLDLVADGGRRGNLSFEAEPGAEIVTGLRGHPITAEQSNTSIVFGNQYILKLFRRLSPGLNKDLLLHRALREVGCEHIADPLGSVTGDLDGEPVTIAMLQRFMPDAVDGWTMATTSVRDLMGDPTRSPDEVGGDFAGESHRLGRAVATVHADLERALGSEVADAATLERTAGEMARRLDAVADRVPELAPHVPALREAFRQVTAVGEVRVQHVHGDLHLGQVLRTVGGWLLLDFEGEPAAPAEERSTLRSPLRDVAGMLRSFDYAAHQLLVQQPHDELLEARAVEWAQRNRDAFCDGYAEVAVGDPRDHPELLRALEMDKAVYEVAYEHANRPDWLPVPLASIARVTKEAGA